MQPGQPFVNISGAPRLLVLTTDTSMAVLFTILNTFLFRVDTVPALHEIYAVERLPLVLGGLALLLTVSGLFSVLSYLVEQRTREIGVRMALGAPSRRVARMILAQTTRPVACGLLAGAGLAASLAAVLLATPMGR